MNYFMVSILILAGLTLLIYITYAVVKSEIDARKYRKVIKVGDKVSFSPMSKSLINCTIKELGVDGKDDMVEVSLVVSKNSIYPIIAKDEDFPIV